MAILKEGGIFELTRPVAKYINGILTNLAPNGELYLVGLFSFIMAYAMKSKNNWSNFMMIIMTVVIYTSLRYFQIGG